MAVGQPRPRAKLKKKKERPYIETYLPCLPLFSILLLRSNYTSNRFKYKNISAMTERFFFTIMVFFLVSTLSRNQVKS